MTEDDQPASSDKEVAISRGGGTRFTDDKPVERISYTKGSTLCNGVHCILSL